MDKPIYAENKLYFFLRPYVDLCCRDSYTLFEITGKENIPNDGAIIIAPNHCNTLMDALVILRSSEEATVFGARADVFKKPQIAKIMKFLKILPMTRIRDGFREVANNLKSIEEIKETLLEGVRYCMFCEGRHRTMHSLLPVSKGILRIAFATCADAPEDKPVYIIPTGIEYGDYFRFRSTCLLNFGKPIEIRQFLKEHSDKNEAEQYRLLASRLHSGISSLITYIPDDENYTSKWEIIKVASAGFKGSLKERMHRNRALAAVLERMDDNAHLFTLAEEFIKERKSKNISIKSLGHKNLWTAILLKTIIGAAILPIYIGGVLMSLPMWASAAYICTKVKDPAFRNTVRFGVKLALTPVMAIIWAAILFCTLGWAQALIAFIFSLCAYSIAFDGKEFYRILFSDWRLAFSKRLGDLYNDILSTFTSYESM